MPTYTVVQDVLKCELSSRDEEYWEDQDFDKIRKIEESILRECVQRGVQYYTLTTASKVLEAHQPVSALREKLGIRDVPVTKEKQPEEKESKPKS